MEVPVLSLSMEVYLPGYDLTPKYEEESQTEEEEDEHEEEDEDENSEEQNEDSEDENSEEQNEDSEDESVKVVHTTPTLAPINVENHDNHDNMTNSGHCTPIPRHNSEPTIPDSPIKRRPTDIEDEIDINSTARILTEDFNNITFIGEIAATAVDLPTIDDAESSDIEPETPPPSIDSVRQEPSESFSSEENDE